MENMGLLLEKMVENNMQLTRGQEDLNLTLSSKNSPIFYKWEMNCLL